MDNPLQVYLHKRQWFRQGNINKSDSYVIHTPYNHNTRANTCNVYRKTVDEIADMLSNIRSSSAAADRERLATLDTQVTHIALVRYRYQNIRANVLYARLDSKGRGRTQISAELPIIYATGRRAEPPEVRFPAGADDTSPKRTRATKLEPKPFLNSLPVYLYSRIVGS